MRAVIGGLALLLVLGVLAYLEQRDAGVTRERAWLGDTPVTVFRPDDAAAAVQPTVVIAHGFAGSQELMQAFAVTLARNGYLAVTFDFLGHGRHRAPLRGDVTAVDGATRHLMTQLQEVIDYTLALPGAAETVALLGHSMASDIIVRQALADPRVAATVAVSMFSPAVTATEPPNLLIIAGEWEPQLRAEALRVVQLAAPDASAGDTVGRFSDGTARRYAIAPSVEHVGVLYSVTSMDETLNWLNAVFDHTGSGYRDQRGSAILLLLAGLVLLAWPLARSLPSVAPPAARAPMPWRRAAAVVLVPMVLTPLLLWPVPGDLLSVLVGGYLAVHFGVYGLLTAGLLWWLRRRGAGAAVAAHGAPVAGAPLLLAVGIWLLFAVGVFVLVLDRYVTAFVPSAVRLPLIAAMLLGTLLYFLADEWLTRSPDAPRGAYAATKLAFLVSLGIAVALSFEELFFLIIIAAIILLFFIVYGLFSRWAYRATGSRLPGALANAVIFAWALAVTFPLMSG